MPKLAVRTPDGKRFTVELSARPVRIGRADSCDIALRNDGEVSREHAEVWLDEDGSVVVGDLNSKNGTRVDDGAVLHNQTRQAYRTIRLGEHVIEIIGARPPGAHSPEHVTFTPDAPTRMGDTHFFPSSRRLDLNQQRLALLISLTERIGGTFDRKQMLQQALDACCEALGFERGLIALKTPRGDTELPVAHNVQRDESGAYKVSRTLINRALLQGERAIVNNPATDLLGDLSESLVRYPICSALCVPILNREEILGVIYGDRVTQASSYQPADVDFLAAIAQQVGVGLANLRLFQEQLRAQNMYAELERARAIQQELLPAEPLRIGRVTVEGYNEPSSAVSGDYFDYFRLEDGRLGVIIADVTGHGLPAALVIANLQAAVRVALAADISLPDLATRINRHMYHSTASHVFITAVLGTIDPASGSVEYVSAGHPGPLLLGPEHVSVPGEENSLPLGIEPEEQYRVRRIHVGEHAQAMLFYTDGLIEAVNPADEFLGLRPVIEALDRLEELTTAAMIRTTRSVVQRHLAGAATADDMTLLAVQFS